ncbi:hypothetical protein jhhlp_005355 [Lomentospora prolificans]|uniref:Hydrophobin n=1 Tax=Lomentospora prolificans TaxID=41688 RepID=A0A2N3N7J2_9PEZI|nr:hypothetical protein jhhlp_005355 [Lomentospora prolificans]
MQFSFATILMGLAAVAYAGVVDNHGMRSAPREALLVSRQNQGRPAPSGTCCVAGGNLKQDACTSAAGEAGRCVPGGNNCMSLYILALRYAVLTDTGKRVGGGALSCVGQSSLTCDANVTERGNTLCRANAPGGGLFDGANIIQNLSQASVN